MLPITLLLLLAVLVVLVLLVVLGRRATPLAEWLPWTAWGVRHLLGCLVRGGRVLANSARR